jgi:hypothetical protein
LSREGEVEIVKKIEQGEKQVIEEVLQSASASLCFDLGEKLAQHEIRVREIIKDGDEDTNISKTKSFMKSGFWIKLERFVARPTIRKKSKGS